MPATRHCIYPICLLVLVLLTFPILPGAVSLRNILCRHYDDAEDSYPHGIRANIRAENEKQILLDLLGIDHSCLRILHRLHRYDQFRLHASPEKLG